MFTPSSQPQLYGATFTNQPDSVLWIFSPRDYSDQAHRPFQYAFNAAFVDAAETALAKRISGDRSNVSMNGLLENPAYMGSSMRVAQQPDHLFHMNLMSERWTFMLVVMNDRLGPGGFSRHMSDTQHLYYGYFADEPVNPNHHGQVTPNPNAMMMVTHKTNLGRLSSIGPRGMDQSRIDIQADLDIINPQEQAMLANTNTVIMRPEDMMDNVANDLSGETVVMHNPSSVLGNLNGVVPIMSSLSLPKWNIKKVFDGIVDAQQSALSASFEGNSLQAMQEHGFDDLVRNNLADNARLYLDTGLPLNQVINLGHVLDRYHPKINVAEQPRTPLYDPINQATGSARNAFASMLASVVPVIMTNQGLGDIAFSYNSYHQAFQIHPESTPSPLTPMPLMQLHDRVNSFVFRMTKEILPILEINRGHYSLEMHCSCAGITNINLNFLDDKYHTPELFEVPNTFGGFNNPLIGSHDMFDHNSRELARFIRTVSDTQRDVPDMLPHHDQRRFQQSLLQYDESVDASRQSPPPAQQPANKWDIF